MDAGVVSGFRPQAFASRTAAERVKTGARSPGAFRISRLPVAERPPQPKVARGRLRRRRSDVLGRRRRRRMRPGIALVAALASGPAALATPPHTLHGLPARII